MIDFAFLPRLETDRLILRSWRESDITAFAEMSADAEVMRFFPSTLSAEQSSAVIAAIQARVRETGYGFHAVEEKASGDFVGFVGLSVPNFEADFLPAVEIGWRIARPHWRKGFAKEAAREALRHGVEDRGLREIISIAPTINRPSISVMQAIGMQRELEGDFIHPALPEDSPLKPLELWRFWP